MLIWAVDAGLLARAMVPTFPCVLFVCACAVVFAGWEACSVSGTVCTCSWVSYTVTACSPYAVDQDCGYVVQGGLPLMNVPCMACNTW